LRLGFLARFDFLLAVQVLETSTDAALVATSGFVLLALELCVFDKDLAVLAPVFWLRNVRFVRSVRVRCTCRGFPVLRHGGSCCVRFATAAAKPSWSMRFTEATTQNGRRSVQGCISRARRRDYNKP
jgi:hypothetical protein